MPHECTNCDRRFPDGSKEMLSGCPDCGGNKFRYRPAGGNLEADASEEAEDEADAAEPTPAPPPDRSGVTDTVSKATRNIREWVGVDDRPEDGAYEEQFDPSPAEDAVVEEGSTPEDQEDAAQATARTSMVEPDDIPEDRPDPKRTADPREQSDESDAVAPGPDDESDLSDLREELNDQFESIKIVEPGQYELNLMELYDRDEYIISLMEDGRYAIEVPETWRGE